MSNQMPPYPEEQRWNSQPRASYPDGNGYGGSPQPQVGYQQGQTPASPYPGNGQGVYPQQQDFAGNNLYPGNNSFASSNPYAAPPAGPTMYRSPANSYAPPAGPTMYRSPAVPPYGTPPVPGVYASPYMQAPYGMVDPNAGKATTGLVLGIITAVSSLVGWLSSLLGIFALLGFVAFLVCGVLGIVFSALGRRSTTKRGAATAGLILSIIGLVVGTLIFIVLLLIGLAALRSQTQ